MNVISPRLCLLHRNEFRLWIFSIFFFFHFLLRRHLAEERKRFQVLFYDHKLFFLSIECKLTIWQIDFSAFVALFGWICGGFCLVVYLCLESYFMTVSLYLSVVFFLLEFTSIRSHSKWKKEKRRMEREKQIAMTVETKGISDCVRFVFIVFIRFHVEQLSVSNNFIHFISFTLVLRLFYWNSNEFDLIQFELFMIANSIATGIRLCLLSMICMNNGT